MREFVPSARRRLSIIALSWVGGAIAAALLGMPFLAYSTVTLPLMVVGCAMTPWVVSVRTIRVADGIVSGPRRSWMCRVSIPVGEIDPVRTRRPWHGVWSIQARDGRRIVMDNVLSKRDRLAVLKAIGA